MQKSSIRIAEVKHKICTVVELEGNGKRVTSEGHKYANTHTHKPTDTHICTHTYTLTHTQIHACTHTHKHMHA